MGVCVAPGPHTTLLCISLQTALKAMDLLAGLWGVYFLKPRPGPQGIH